VDDTQTLDLVYESTGQVTEPLSVKIRRTRAPSVRYRARARRRNNASAAMIDIR